MRDFCYWLSAPAHRALTGLRGREQERSGLALATVFKGLQMERKSMEK